MRFDILTLFPDIIYNYTSESILRRAQQAGLIKIGVHNFRDFALDKHHRVDDRAYGGGAGMVLKVDPIYECLKTLLAIGGKTRLRQGGAKKIKQRVIILDPAGKKFDQAMAKKFSQLDRLVLICGRYQGFDERVYKFVDEKVSIGDFVLSGGELPALEIVEATSRLLPGVLGNEESKARETFVGQKTKSAVTKGLNCECPLYTRPDDFMGLKVPKVLLSGNHDLIKKWQEENFG